MIRFDRNVRHAAVGSFLAGMLVMGLLFLAIGTASPEQAFAENEPCGRSIAVANALHEFIVEQHGELVLPDGTKIVRDDEIGIHDWKLGFRP